MKKPKIPLSLYHLYHQRDGQATCPEHWWDHESDAYTLVALLRASSFADVCSLVVHDESGAWYTHQGVALQGPSPVRVARDGDVLVCEDGETRDTWMRVAGVWTAIEAPQLELLLSIKHDAVVRLVACSPDGNTFAGLDRDSLLRVYAAANPRRCGTYGRHSGSLKALAWSPDGRMMASGDTSGELHLWDVLQGDRFTHHAEDERVLLCLSDAENRDISALAWSPDSRKVATGHRSGTVCEWDAESGRIHRRYRFAQQRIESVAYSPDAWYLAATCAGTVYLQDTDAPTIRRSFSVEGDHARHQQTLAWSPSGDELLMSSSGLHEVVCYHMQHALTTATKRIALSSYANRWGTTSVSYSPHGRFAAVGCADGTVQVVDTEQGRQIHTFHAHRGTVHAVAWSQNGTRIVSGGEDHYLRVWRVPSAYSMHPLE